MGDKGNRGIRSLVVWEAQCSDLWPDEQALAHSGQPCVAVGGCLPVVGAVFVGFRLAAVSAGAVHSAIGAGVLFAATFEQGVCVASGRVYGDAR